MLKNNKGVTLLELIITIAIVGIVFLLIAPLFFTGINFFGDSNAMVMDQANLRKIMTDISREIRDATEVTVDSETQITVDDCIYTYADGKITKTFTDTGTEVVVSERIAEFTAAKNGEIVELRVRAEGKGSTIITKVGPR